MSSWRSSSSPRGGGWAANIAQLASRAFAISVAYPLEVSTFPEGDAEDFPNFTEGVLSVFTVDEVGGQVDSFGLSPAYWAEEANLLDLHLRVESDGSTAVLFDRARTSHRIDTEARTATGGPAIDGLSDQFWYRDSLYYVDGFWDERGPHLVNAVARRGVALPAIFRGDDAVRAKHTPAPDGRILSYGVGGRAYLWTPGDEVAEELDWYPAPHQIIDFVEVGEDRVAAVFIAAYEQDDLDDPQGGVSTFGRAYAFSRACFLLSAGSIDSLYAPRAQSELTVTLEVSASTPSTSPDGALLWTHEFSSTVGALPENGLSFGSSLQTTSESTVLGPRSDSVTRSSTLLLQLSDSDSLTVEGWLLHAGYYPLADYGAGYAKAVDMGPVSLRELPASSSTLSPNPTAGRVVLRSESMDLGRFKWTLFDAAGRGVAVPLDFTTERGVTLDATGLPAGVYVVVGTDGESFLRRRLVVE